LSLAQLYKKCDGNFDVYRVRQLNNLIASLLPVSSVTRKSQWGEGFGGSLGAERLAAGEIEGLGGKATSAGRFLQFFNKNRNRLIMIEICLKLHYFWKNPKYRRALKGSTSTDPLTFSDWSLVPRPPFTFDVNCINSPLNSTFLVLHT